MGSGNNGKVASERCLDFLIEMVAIGQIGQQNRRGRRGCAVFNKAEKD